MFILLAALVIVPIAEITVMVKVAEWIGVGQMIALLLSISIVGAWIVKRQGTGTLRRIRAELNAGRVPGAHLIDWVAGRVARPHPLGARRKTRSVATSSWTPRAPTRAQRAQSSSANGDSTHCFAIEYPLTVLTAT
jgi:hypothetical protein